MVFIKNNFTKKIVLALLWLGIALSVTAQSAYEERLQQQLVPDASVNGYIGIKFKDFNRRFRIQNFKMEPSLLLNGIEFSYPFPAGSADSVHYYFQDDYRFHFPPYQIVDSAIRIAGARFFYHDKKDVNLIAAKVYGDNYLNALKKKPNSNFLLFSIRLTDKKSQLQHRFDIMIDFKKNIIEITEPVLFENWSS